MRQKRSVSSAACAPEIKMLYKRILCFNKYWNIRMRQKRSVSSAACDPDIIM